ncbi:hypothetical protein LZ009_15685 [Ramlibacter sp. XY19]|uniref:hypothetical protein n=1 Tax=Ramlibacter paludis TaxID=2908000 RepID=UPI0023DC3B9B|nr:hypothetical protein [Ramlibacter paludis]MCG2594224.1 hypothetical protein [Ramlibacter paludis]
MNDDKTRARMAAELESLLRDEGAHFAKARRTSFVFKAVGIACIVGAWAIAGMPWHWPSVAAAVLAAIGGVLAGASIAFDTSAKSWPVLRPLLRDDALAQLE